MGHVKKLIDEHWEYIKGLLIAHRADTDELLTIKFHYKSAFRHGYKHGVESRFEQTKFPKVETTNGTYVKEVLLRANQKPVILPECRTKNYPGDIENELASQLNKD